MICRQCGTEVPEEGQFCHKCGAPVGDTVDAAPRQPVSGVGWISRPVLAAGGLLIIGITLISLFAAGVLSGGDEEDSPSSVLPSPIPPTSTSQAADTDMRDDAIKLNEYLDDFPYEVTIRLPSGTRVLDGFASECPDGEIDATWAVENDTESLLLGSVQAEYLSPEGIAIGSLQTGVGDMYAAPEGKGFIVARLPSSTHEGSVVGEANLSIAESSPLFLAHDAEPYSLEVQVSEDIQAAEWSAVVEITNTGNLRVDTLPILGLLLDESGGLQGVLEHPGADNYLSDVLSVAAGETSERSLSMPTTCSDRDGPPDSAATLEYWLPATGLQTEMFVYSGSTTLKDDAGRLALAEQGIEAQTTVTHEGSLYTSDCYRCPSVYEIGPASITGDVLTIPFRHIVEGDPAFMVAEDCPVVWMNSLDFHAQSVEEGGDGIHITDALGNRYELSDVSGVAAQDAPLACDKWYDGAWLFNVARPVGKVVLNHPDMGAYSLTVSR